MLGIIINFNDEENFRRTIASIAEIKQDKFLFVVTDVETAASVVNETVRDNYKFCLSYSELYVDVDFLQCDYLMFLNDDTSIVPESVDKNYQVADDLLLDFVKARCTDINSQSTQTEYITCLQANIDTYRRNSVTSCDYDEKSLDKYLKTLGPDLSTCIFSRKFVIETLKLLPVDEGLAEALFWETFAKAKRFLVMSNIAAIKREPLCKYPNSIVLTYINGYNKLKNALENVAPEIRRKILQKFLERTFLVYNNSLENNTIDIKTRESFKNFIYSISKNDIELKTLQTFLYKEQAHILLKYCHKEEETIVVNEPVITVIVSGKVNKELGDCLDSILNQQEKRIEIIVACSDFDDIYLSRLKEYSIIDKRVKMLFEREFSVLEACQNAQGKYIYFVNSKDLLDNKCIHNMYIAAENYQAEIVCSRYLYLNGSDKPVKSVMPKWTYLPSVIVFSWQDDPYFIFQLTLGELRNKLVLTDLAKEYFEHYGQTETELCSAYKMLLEAKRITRIDYSGYVVREKALATADDVLQLVDAFKSLQEFLQEKKIFMPLKQSFHNLQLFYFYNCLNNGNGLDSFNLITNYILSQGIQDMGLAKYPKSYFYDTVYYDFIKKLIDCGNVEACLYFNYLQQKSLLENSALKIKSLEANQKKFEQELSVLKRNTTDIVKAQKKYKSELEKYFQGKAFWYTISYIPRKIKNGLKCLKEHGTVYTLRRIAHKFGSFKV